MLSISFILLRLRKQPRITRNSHLHSDSQPSESLRKWAIYFFFYFSYFPLTLKEINKDDFLEEVPKFLLLPASGVQVLFCSCFSFPKQVSSLLLIVVQHIHCLYEEGLVKSVDATFLFLRAVLVFIILISALNFCQLDTIGCYMLSGKLLH